MKFTDFQEVMSAPRMSRYLTAIGGSPRKAMTLYRLNLRLSQGLFTIISCFEIALRNRIDQHPTKDTAFSRYHYLLIRQLFQWMQIDESALLYGIDHITKVLSDIDRL